MFLSLAVRQVVLPFAVVGMQIDAVVGFGIFALAVEDLVPVAFAAPLAVDEVTVIILVSGIYSDTLAVGDAFGVRIAVVEAVCEPVSSCDR